MQRLHIDVHLFRFKTFALVVACTKNILFMYKKNFIHFWGIALLSLFSQKTICQDTVRYVGKTLVNVDYHHGQLPLAVGVHNYQTFRANREHPEWAGGSSWTYNHAPMLAYWNNTFFLEFLSDPVGEHIPPGQTFLQTSSNGKDWTNPVVLFPPIKFLMAGRRKDIKV
jgi:hypothetical protein